LPGTKFPYATGRGLVVEIIFK